MIKTIGIDIDGVIVNTEKVLRDILYENTGIVVTYEQFNQFLLENVLSEPPFNVDHKESIKIVSQIFRQFNAGRLRDAKPMPGAAETIRRLSNNGWRIFICTARTKSTEAITIDQLSDYGIYYDELVFAKDKLQYADKLTTFVDDNGDTATNMAEAGVTSILFDHPWNRMFNTQLRVHNWNEIIELLRC